MKKLFALLLLSACACVSSPGVRPPGIEDNITGLVVKVQHGQVSGTGAVIGEHLVATVAHVTKDASTVWICGGKRSRQVMVIPTTGFEAIIVLETDDTWGGWSEEEIFKIKAGGKPSEIWTLHDKQPFKPSHVIPGDSGSPVLDQLGNLIGHVSACRYCGTDDQTTIYSPYPVD